MDKPVVEGVGHLSPVEVQLLGGLWREDPQVVGALKSLWVEQMNRWVSHLRQDKGDDLYVAQGALNALEQLWNRLEGVALQAKEEG